MAEQLELLPEFKAHEYAVELSDQLSSCDDEDDVPGLLNTFYSVMRGLAKKSDSYAYLDVVGLGALREAFVFWVEDDSILLVGWLTPCELSIGVLPPTSQFIATAYEGGRGHTIH